jgi:hypothetical protein
VSPKELERPVDEVDAHRGRDNPGAGLAADGVTGSQPSGPSRVLAFAGRAHHVGTERTAVRSLAERNRR